MSLGETLDALGNVTKALVAPQIDDTANIDYDTARQAVEAVASGNGHMMLNTNGTTTYTVLINGKAHGFTEQQLDLYKQVVNSGRTVNISKLTTSERVKAAIGFGDYGRINFQANSGNVVRDIITEVALDPAVWISAGTSGVAKVAAGQVDDAIKVFAKDIDDYVQAFVPVTERDLARDTAAKLIDDAARQKIVEQVLMFTVKVQVIP